ncbi:hypothetical protein ABKN59_008832 [Abortiporus biennis]
MRRYGLSIAFRRHRDMSDMNIDSNDNQPEASSSAKDIQPASSTSEVQPATSSAMDVFSKTLVGYVYDNRMMMHSCVKGHSEAPERISRIFDSIKQAGCLNYMVSIPIREVQKEEALLVHNESLWDKVIAVSAMTEQDVADSEAYYDDLSLYVHPNTPLAARLSSGGVIEATLAVARGLMRKSFAIVRPPGHHAEPDEHMGFCFFNNVAIATRVAQQLTPMKKILILDWDVHHGNGTQRAFYDDPSVLYMSLHRFDGGQFYPNGTFGSVNSCGEGPGLGFSVNVPWPTKGMGDADYLHAFQAIIMPIAVEFAPDLVIISAGFDAAEGDELGECHVSPAGYAHMTHMLSALAGGRLVVALEGGYNLDAISASALAVTRVLLGEAPPELPPMVASQIATETVWQVALEQSKHWKNIKPKACEPAEEMETTTFSVPELLKAHRQKYLFQTHHMLQVPFATPALEERYMSQVTCTDDMMDNETVIVFVHEFGNLRGELDGQTMCNLQLEHSYLVDFSNEMIAWVKQKDYALLDVNVYPKPATATSRGKQKDTYAGDLMVYLWDNYIQLTSARRVLLIGHGPGCDAIMHLIQHRTFGVMKAVKAIVQVVGHYDIPSTPRNADDIRTWYLKHSLVVVPINHRIFTEGKVLKKHGNVLRFDEPKPIKLISKALPAICQFIETMLHPAD